MSAVDFNTLAYLHGAADPSSVVFKTILADLYAVAESKVSTEKGDEYEADGWTRKFPFCGSAVENKKLLDDFSEFTVSDKATYTQGVVSLAKLFSRVCAIYNNVRTIPKGRVLIVSSYARELCDMFSASDPFVEHIDFLSSTNYQTELVKGKYSYVVFDHTTVTASINKLLAVAADAGVSMIEGIFFFSPAVDHGWSGVFGDDKIMINHTDTGVAIGPADDPTRILHYTRRAYRQFVDPSSWGYKARRWYYEIKSHGLQSTYTATFVGDHPLEKQTFRVPVCSSPDMVMITVDKRLASGLFSASGSNPGVMDGKYREGLTGDRTVATTFATADIDGFAFSGRRDHAIEVRKKLFDDAVLYLVARQKGTDLVTEAIKYVAAHNYSDLFEGARVITAHSLSYTDALCVAVVCAVQAYVLRYGLTNESIRAIVNAKDQSKALAARGFTGFFGRLSYVLRKYVTRVLYDNPSDYLQRANARLVSTDMVPGVFYDIYRDRMYEIGAKWYETGVRSYQPADSEPVGVDDPITGYMGGVVDTSAPSYLIDKEATEALRRPALQRDRHPYQPVAEPAKKFQDFYDTTFPGNSVADLANVAELRKTRDLKLTLEFRGSIKVGMDTAKVELLHDAMPVRTSALPPGRAGLTDSLLATAKRNFSVPDMHDITDVYVFARRLVDEFILHACVPNAKAITEGYMLNPIQLNVNSYNNWLAGKGEAYYRTLLGEVPDDLVVLGLEKYTSILKSRVKPKLSVSATQVLGQPQVVNHQRKTETALYSGEFRKAFERFDSLLADGYFSAGRTSDEQISDWLTDHMSMVTKCACFEADSSMYDKSQAILALMVEVEMLTRLGLSASITEDLKRSFVGSVNARNAGLTFIIAMQRKSGHVDTMIGNLIFNFVSLGSSIGYDKIAGMIAKGDDNIAFIFKWAAEKLAPHIVAEKMGRYFNLESKIIVEEVPGFSSGGVVAHGSRLRFFPDPVKLVELLGEKTIDGGLLDRERFESFRDRVSAYDYEGLPELIAQWVRSRYRVGSDVVGVIDALLTVASDFELYKQLR